MYSLNNTVEQHEIKGSCADFTWFQEWSAWPTHGALGHDLTPVFVHLGPHTKATELEILNASKLFSA